MEITLNFNKVGQLDGFQYVEYTLGDHLMNECHYFTDGFEDVSAYWMQATSQSTMRSYFFDASDWGTVEIARDAAEEFAMYGQTPVTMVKVHNFFQVKPNCTEAVYE